MSSNTPPPTTPQSSSPTTNETLALADVVKELNKAILALRTLIEREYPNRREIEAEFVRKTSSDKRLRILLATILVSSLIGFFSTLSTVSTCFLGDPNHPDACNLIPGYSDANERNEQILRRFGDLILDQEKMNDRLERLERGAS